MFHYCSVFLYCSDSVELGKKYLNVCFMAAIVMDCRALTSPFPSVLLTAGRSSTAHPAASSAKEEKWSSKALTRPSSFVPASRWTADSFSGVITTSGNSATSRMAAVRCTSQRLW